MKAYALLIGFVVLCLVTEHLAIGIRKSDMQWNLSIDARVGLLMLFFFTVLGGMMWVVAHL